MTHDNINGMLMISNKTVTDEGVTMSITSPIKFFVFLIILSYAMDAAGVFN